MLLLVALATGLLFFDFGTRVISTNDEARFPVMARDILARGHWLAPEINGVPMLNKPPLHAWLIAIAASLTGSVTPRTAVLPSLLGAIGVIVGTTWIGRRLFDPHVGVTAGLVTMTTAGVFALARSPVPDMTLSAFLVGAIAAFVAAEFEGRRTLPAFYLLVACAFWLKGPAGLLPVAIALTYETTLRGWRGARRLVSPTGFAVLAVAVIGWSGLALAAGRAAFVQDVVVTDMLIGYFKAHRGWTAALEPVGHALTISLPWAVVLPLALWHAAGRVRTAGDRATAFTAVWALVVFAVVAVSARQRWRYYLPLCAPIALLVAAWIGRLGDRLWHRVFAVTWVVVAVGLVVGEVHADRTQLRRTDVRPIARVLADVKGPVYALEAAETVFEFYLERPVLVVRDYATFARQRDARYIIASEDAIPGDAGGPRVRVLATTRVAGRRLVLLGKDGAP